MSTTTTTTFVASEGELELVHRIYERAGCSRPGFISGDALVDIFTASVDLTPHVLSQIWNIADEDKTGNLSERGLAIALRLIGWAQRGESVDVALVNMRTRFTFDSFVVPLTNPQLGFCHISMGSAQSPRPQQVHSVLPSQRQKQERTGLPLRQAPSSSSQICFMKADPSTAFFMVSFSFMGFRGIKHCLIWFSTGDKVRDIFLQTKLPAQDLWQIWYASFSPCFLTLCS